MYVLVLVLSRCSLIQLFATPLTVANQAPLSMGFSRQEYWSGLPCLHSGAILDPGIEPLSAISPASQADSLLLSHGGSPYVHTRVYVTKYCAEHNNNFN